MSETVTLHGGPCDGEALDVSGLSVEERAVGVALTSPGCAYPGGRACYEPDGDGVWRWAGDVP